MAKTARKSAAPAAAPGRPNRERPDEPKRYKASKDELLDFYKQMLLIRRFEERAGQLYGLGFKENTGAVPVFHPDVRTFEVTDQASGKVVGLFYLDNFAREGKRSGAWMTTYRSRAGLLGDDIFLRNYC